MTLASLQALFWSAARGQASMEELDAQFVGRAGRTGAGRMRIYNGAYFVRLEAALADSFACTQQLLGVGPFRALARRYIINFPSEHPALERVGGRFPEMLARDPQGPGRRIAGVAALEWARVEALLSPEDSTVTGPLAIGGVSAASVRVHWVRSLRLCATTVASFRAFKAPDLPRAVDHEADTPCVIAFWRKGFQVHHLSLEALEQRLLADRPASIGLLEMCEQVADQCDYPVSVTFDLVRAWLARGWVARVEIGADPRECEQEYRSMGACNGSVEE